MAVLRCDAQDVEQGTLDLSLKFSTIRRGSTRRSSHVIGFDFASVTRVESKKLSKIFCPS